MSGVGPPEDRAESDSALPVAKGEGDQPRASRITTGNGLDRSEPARPKQEIDLGAFRRGEGFETVLEQFGPLIHSVAHRYAVDGDEAEDIYQEACIRIYGQCHTFQDGSLPVWIYRTADRCCRNFVRARRSRQAATERYSVVNPSGVAASAAPTSPWRHVLRAEADARFRRALARLSERQAHAFVLTQVDGYSAREAARIMGATVSTVRSNVRHAKKKLRKYWKEEE